MVRHVLPVLRRCCAARRRRRRHRVRVAPGRSDRGSALTAWSDGHAAGGRRGGVPTSGVSAVVMNVTVASPTAAGFVQVCTDTGDEGCVLQSQSRAGSHDCESRRRAARDRRPGRPVHRVVQHAGTLDLLADVVGYFTDGTAPSTTSGCSFRSRRPATSTLVFPAPQPKVASGGIVNVSTAALAPGASAIAGNLTSTGGGRRRVSATRTEPGFAGCVVES